LRESKKAQKWGIGAELDPDLGFGLSGDGCVEVLDDLSG
jgi:hypothetical protein